MKQLKAIFASMLLMGVIAFTACSDNDDPKPEPDPKPADWKENPISVTGVPSYSVPNFMKPAELTAYIAFLDENGVDLLDSNVEGNLCKSDWYFVVDGKEYHSGQIIPMDYSEEAVCVRYHNGIMLNCITPTWIDWKTLEYGAVHQTLTFVFPEKNISKQIDFYAEINPDLDFQSENEEVLYKKGVLIDGKPLDGLFANMGIWTIIL